VEGDIQSSGPQPPTPVCILAVRREGRLAALLVSRDVLTKAQMSACGDKLKFSAQSVHYRL
jgi:hypothetical protein